MRRVSRFGGVTVLRVLGRSPVQSVCATACATQPTCAAAAVPLFAARHNFFDKVAADDPYMAAVMDSDVAAVLLLAQENVEKLAAGATSTTSRDPRIVESLFNALIAINAILRTDVLPAYRAAQEASVVDGNEPTALSFAAPDGTTLGSEELRGWFYALMRRSGWGDVVDAVVQRKEVTHTPGELWGVTLEGQGRLVVVALEDVASAVADFDVLTRLL